MLPIRDNNINFSQNFLPSFKWFSKNLYNKWENFSLLIKTKFKSSKKGSHSKDYNKSRLIFLKRILFLNKYKMSQ